MISLLLVALLRLATPPSSRNQATSLMIQRLGRPVSETYLLRKDVYVTVTYARTGDACPMIISPQPPTDSFDYPATKTMKSSELTAIIDELVPKEERGKRGMGTFLNLTCRPSTTAAAEWTAMKSSELFESAARTRSDTRRFNGPESNATNDPVKI